jgi:hypothetical protein
VHGERVCEVCDNRNAPGSVTCEWCETVLTTPMPTSPSSSSEAGLDGRYRLIKRPGKPGLDTANLWLTVKSVEVAAQQRKDFEGLEPPVLHPGTKPVDGRTPPRAAPATRPSSVPTRTGPSHGLAALLVVAVILAGLLWSIGERGHRQSTTLPALPAAGSVRLGATVAEMPVGTILAGQQVGVSASGAVGYGYEGAADCAGYPTADPDGNRTLAGTSCPRKYDPLTPLPSAPVASLLVSLSRQGPWQFVGSHGTFIAPEPGTLYFAHNDGYRADDTGFYTIEYRVTG